MPQLSQELFLIHDRVYTSLRDDSSFVHFFHCVELFFLFLLDFPNFAKASPADDVVEHKMILVYSYSDITQGMKVPEMLSFSYSVLKLQLPIVSLSLKKGLPFQKLLLIY